ncbi:MAG: DUF4079 domain-containing protein [Leptolyngbya sp. SIOISBB]|nr:DUF4079 domain-containing protein [Leptolyngbya sp. SIOISBB]
MGEQLTALLKPVADWFAQFGMPEPIVHWGHPIMMGIVVLVMGSTATYMGWKIRTGSPGEDSATTRKLHKKLALWMTTFIGLGYTGGVLSLVMQNHPVLESPHFWTGTLAIGLLGVNGAISMSKFGGGKASLRTTHAYIGSVAMVFLLVHAFLGVKLGLSI